MAVTRGVDKLVEVLVVVGVVNRIQCYHLHNYIVLEIVFSAILVWLIHVNAQHVLDIGMSFCTVQTRASISGEGCSLERRLGLLARIVRATVPNCVLCGPIKHKDYLNVVRGNISLRPL